MVAYLPTPPTDEEKLAYLDPRGRWLGLVGLISLATFGLITLQSYHRNILFLIYLPFAIAYLVKMAFGAFGSWFARPFDYEKHSCDRIAFAHYVPSVDIFLPNCGEPLEVIANQFKNVKEIDYPNYQVWVLDDKGDDEVRILTELHGFNYLSRPNKGELKKAGNLRYAFAQTEGELILVLDADFVPRADMLNETVFRFAQNEKLAILQTPQYFGNGGNQAGQSNSQLGLGFFQEIFYRLVQNFRDRIGAAICCGSCAIFRRSALAPHGGGAPVKQSEDVHTGWMLLSDGWEIEYLPLCLSSGLSPETVRSTFNQHYRWCSGSYSLTCSSDFWSKPNISFVIKLCYFSAFFFYSTSALGILFHAIPVYMGLWTAPTLHHATIVRVGVPSIALVIMCQAMWSKSRWGLFVILTGTATAYTYLVALIDVLFGNIAPWVPSGANTSNGRFERFVWLLSIVPMALLGGAIAIVIYRHVGYGRAAMPLTWLSLQVFASWLVLAQIRREERRESNSTNP